MKKFNGSISEIFGLLIVILLSRNIIHFISKQIHIKYIFSFLLYFFICCLILFICHKIFILAYNFAYNKKYKTSILIALLVSWTDIVFAFKYIKLINAIRKNENLEKIQEFFNDKNREIQYISLLMYLNNYDSTPVLKWFEDNYLNKNLPIESDFFPIYKWITEQKTKE